MNNYLATRRKVMTHIYFEYTKNMFLGYPDYFMSVIFLVTSFMFVSLHDVITNIPKDTFSGMFNFFVMAIRNTYLILQILIAGIVVRVAIAGSKLIYRSMKNLNLNNVWLISRKAYILSRVFSRAVSSSFMRPFE